MIAVSANDFESWRNLARTLLGSGTTPDQLHWSGETPSLFETAEPAPPSTRLTVPKDFLELAKTVALHADEERWGVLYRTLYRIVQGEHDLLKVDIDDDVRRLRLMEKAVHRDMHKMTAFVRFRKVEGSNPEQFVAWHRPDNHILEAMAPWFVKRFGSMRWTILTPERSAYWDLNELRLGPGVPRSEAPGPDTLEDLWKDYYAAIFNPARVKIKAMKAEMPTRHWATLPETQLIPSLLLSANERVTQMGLNQKSSAAPWVPASRDLSDLHEAAKACQGCELYRHASQVVFGEGSVHSKVVMVGEQPGNDEDLKGLPFVGPAGRLLDKAMVEAGLDRKTVYVTNAVKHFKFVERGKRRIHAKPTGIEISSCKPWLEAELTAIEPELLVCLGATAAQSLMGRDFRITADRGKFFPHRWAKELVATIHPSAILRTLPERRDEEYGLLVRDLRLVAERIAQFAA